MNEIIPFVFGLLSLVCVCHFRNHALVRIWPQEDLNCSGIIIDWFAL